MIALSWLIIVCIVAYFVSTGIIEGFRERMYTFACSHGDAPGDDHWLIQDDGKRKFWTYHTWRMIQTGSIIIAALSGALGGSIHWWLVVLLWVWGDRLYNRFLCLVQYSNIFAKQPDYVQGLKTVKRWPVWYDCAIVVVGAVIIVAAIVIFGIN
jgi:hypothetical protein